MNVVNTCCYIHTHLEWQHTHFDLDGLLSSKTPAQLTLLCLSLLKNYPERFTSHHDLPNSYNKTKYLDMPEFCFCVSPCLYFYKCLVPNYCHTRCTLHINHLTPMYQTLTLLTQYQDMTLRIRDTDEFNIVKS